MLTLQFGQCGNQIGNKLYSKIIEDLKITRTSDSSVKNQDYVEDSKAKWFGSSKSGGIFARAVLIDTENKVTNKIKKQKQDLWCYRSNNIISGDSSSGGSANNWAYGYVKKGPEFDESVHESIRNELELTDKVDTFFCLSGCAGGTGSGLGSYITQSVRDEYPKKNILSTLLLPFGSGEIATQNYNTLLSLAKIIDSADMLIIMENDKLNNELTKSVNLKSHTVNFPNDINDIACQKLLSILQSANDVENNLINDVNYMVSKLVPHPAYKFTSIETIPLTLPSNNSNSLLDKSLWSVQKDTINWQTQFKYLRRNLLSSSLNEGNKFRSLANVLITRGFNNDKVKVNNKLVYNQRDDPFDCDELIKNDIYAKLKWMTSYDKLRHFHQNRRFLNYDKLSSLITNNSSVNKSLDGIVDKAWNSYTYGAFLHQYKKFELEDDDFLSAFTKIEAVISSYNELERHS
ncbi:tubulin delta chain [Microplitis demolitor]|uniref:tubulin delta chain n=1 Tax=Microplitis demolitor TaxID=69319 RepID=UPI0004CD7432|nr:tubulin delta chain [Microplitis demolitor]